MNKKLLWMVALWIFLGFSTFLFFRMLREERKPLLKTQVVVGDIRKIVRGLGYLEAEKMYPIQAPFSGRLEKIFVQGGDQIQPRALLFKIKNPDFEKNYRLIQAQYRKADVQLQKMRVGADPDALSQAQAELNKARILSQELSKESLDKLELFEKGFISKKEMEDVKSRRETAFLEEKIALQRYKKATEPPPQEEIDLKEAEVSKMKVELDRLREQWQKRKTRATFSALVVEVLKKTGESVSENESLLTLVNRDEPWVIQGAVYESEIGKISKGSLATVSITGMEGKFSARVTEVSMTAQSTGGTRKFPVKLLLAGKIEGPLRLGVGADYEIVIAEKKNVLTLPLQFIAHQEGRVGVWCEKGHRLKFIPLELGLQDDTSVEVVKGLEVGEEVVLWTGGAE